jgi:hypothetical protein
MSDDALLLRGRAVHEIWRGAHGGYHRPPDETFVVDNLIVNAGRIYLAKRAAGGDTVASVMAYMAVGTATAAAALTDTTLPGEGKRKPLAVYSATTNNIITAVVTFGGAADSVQSVAWTEAGIFNHANSGQGTMKARFTFASVTLADSDLWKITHETNVGSNTI